MFTSRIVVDELSQSPERALEPMVLKSPTSESDTSLGSSRSNSSLSSLSSDGSIASLLSPVSVGSAPDLTSPRGPSLIYIVATHRSIDAKIIAKKVQVSDGEIKQYVRDSNGPSSTKGLLEIIERDLQFAKRIYAQVALAIEFNYGNSGTDKSIVPEFVDLLKKYQCIPLFITLNGNGDATKSTEQNQKPSIELLEEEGFVYKPQKEIMVKDRNIKSLKSAANKKYQQVKGEYKEVSVDSISVDATLPELAPAFVSPTSPVRTGLGHFNAPSSLNGSKEITKKEDEKNTNILGAGVRS